MEKYRATRKAKWTKDERRLAVSLAYADGFLESDCESKSDRLEGEVAYVNQARILLQSGWLDEKLLEARSEGLKARWETAYFQGVLDAEDGSVDPDEASFWEAKKHEYKREAQLEVYNHIKQALSNDQDVSALEIMLSVGIKFARVEVHG